MKRIKQLSAVLAMTGLGLSAQAAELTPEQKQLRSIYQELVETNTTNSAGSCTLAAQRMAKRLKSAGYRDAEMQILTPPGAPKKGNLMARLKGDGSKKPLMLLAHIDVVEAKPEDWVRNPFKLVEEDGVFYARGSSDDKSMASIFVDTMMRFKQEKLASKRDVILALTCDEETDELYNGVSFLAKHHRNLIDAEIALNEGGGGLLDKDGKPVRHGVQAGEKVFQNFQLEVTNKGGHSSVPPRDNAIYHLSEALSKLGKFDFPFRLTDVTRSYFERMSKIETGQVAQDMQAILNTPPDAAALERLYAVSPANNSMVRTTCVATMVNAGHALNALPQRARAVVNCRILPGDPIEEIQQTIVRVINDDQVKVSALEAGVISAPPPLTPTLMKAVEDTSNEIWPGVPVIPTMSTGATDGRYLNNVGIWTYGISGLFHGPEGNNAHGLNEHLRVKSLYNGQTFLYRLSKRLATE